MVRTALPKITTGIAKSSWWIFIAAVVLTALALAAGRYLASTVDDNQEQIEAFLHENGFEYVQIGKIESNFQTFDPRFHVENLHFDVDGEAVLEVDQLLVRLDSLSTLIQQTPIVAEVSVSGVRFVLDRVDGQTSIRGMPRREGSVNLDYLLNSIPHLQVVRLDNIDIDVFNEGIHLKLKSAEGEPWYVVEEGNGEKLISLTAILTRPLHGGASESSEVHLMGRYQGDVREAGFKADLFLDVPRLDLENVFPKLNQATRLAHADMNGRLWVSMAPDDVDITSQLELSDVRLGVPQGEVNLLSKVSASARYHGASLTHGSMLIPSLALQAGETEFRLEDLTVALGETGGKAGYAGRLAELDVTAVMAMLSELADSGVISERLSNALNAVNPRGRLVDIGVQGEFGSSDVRVTSRVASVSMDAYLGVPAISDINGFLSVSPRRGFIDIHNDEFSMNFANMFSEAWPFSSARGRVGYDVRADKLVVHSGLIELIDGDLSAYGKVSLSLPPEQALQTWGLTIGIRDADLLDASRYLPNTLNEDLTRWLDNAIGGGTGVESGLLFHGALFRGSPAVRKTHSTYFKVEDATMNYHEDWPVITDLAATVHVASHEVTSRGGTGRVFDTDVADIEVVVPVPPAGVDTVLVNAEASGDMSDAIRTLNETPLAETTSNMASYWSGEGPVSASLQLNVGLGERQDEEVGSDVRLGFNGATLDMADFDLRTEQLSGTARYTNLDGISSEGFKGVMFGEEINGTITSQLFGSGGEIVVSVNGAINAVDLYGWSEQILLTRAEGKTGYSASVHVPFGGAKDLTWVEASTDLVGLTLELPAPLAKPEADTEMLFSYTQIFLDDGYRVDMSADDNIKASLKIADGIAKGGRIHFGETPLGVVTYDAIRMSGRIAYLDYESWMDTTDALSAISDVSLESEINRHVHSLDLMIDELSLFSLELEDAKTLVTRGDDHWLASIDNETMRGVVRVDDDDLAPIDINLDYLRFTTEDGDGEDPFGDTDPISFDPIDFATRQLLLDEEDYGAWSFKYRVDGEVAVLSEVTAEALGVSVLPSSTATWQIVEGEHYSHFEGDIEISDLGHALEQFGFASSIEGEGLKLDADVSWPGSPAMVDINNLRGLVNLHEGKGKFVQAETGGALKLLGIFDFAQLARRFRLDFSDVVSKGYEFNDISGTTRLDAGAIDVTEPIVILSSSGKFTVGGSVDLNTRELDNDMVVTLPVGRTLPWYAAYSAIATGPLAGAGVMIAQRLFEDQIDTMSSAKYHISGTIEDPLIEFVTIFDDSVRGGESEGAAEESAEPQGAPEVTEDLSAVYP